MAVEPLHQEGPQTGLCPSCGQPLPTGFATGTRSLSPDPEVRRIDDPPDPDGPEGYEVITRLARGEEPRDIAYEMALTLPQVESLIPHVGTATNRLRGVMR